MQQAAEQAQAQRIATQHQRAHQQRVTERQEGPAQPLALQLVGPHIGSGNGGDAECCTDAAPPQAGDIQFGLGTVQHDVGECPGRPAQARIDVPAHLEAMQLGFAVDHQHLFADRCAGQVLEEQLQFPLREAAHLHAGLFGLFDQRAARFTIGQDRLHPVQCARRPQQQVVQESEQQRQP